MIRPDGGDGQPDAICRPTCARFARCSIARGAPRPDDVPRPRDHRRRQGQCLRPRRVAGGARARRRRRRRCSRVPTSKRASRCATAGVTLPILVFGALSVSDLDGRLRASADADGLDAGARRGRSRRRPRARGVRLGCHLKIDTGMNRLGFRHDNLRRTMPAVLGSPHLRIDAVYTHFATADEPESPFLDEQRGAFRPRARRRSARWAPRRAAARRQLGGAAARHADLVRRPSGRGCCSTASCRRRSSSNARAATRPVTDEPYRGGQGPAAGRRRRATACAGGPTGRGRSRSCRPATPTDSTRERLAGRASSCAAVACPSSARCAWT